MRRREWKGSDHDRNFRFDTGHADVSYDGKNGIIDISFREAPYPDTIEAIKAAIAPYGQVMITARELSPGSEDWSYVAVSIHMITQHVPWAKMVCGTKRALVAVSYTHLTLPTIYSV